MASLPHLTQRTIERSASGEQPRLHGSCWDAELDRDFGNHDAVEVVLNQKGSLFDAQAVERAIKGRLCETVNISSVVGFWLKLDFAHATPTTDRHPARVDGDAVQPPVERVQASK
jgi:hypothetical protein